MLPIVGGERGSVHGKLLRKKCHDLICILGKFLATFKTSKDKRQSRAIGLLPQAHIRLYVTVKAASPEL